MLIIPQNCGADGLIIWGHELWSVVEDSVQPYFDESFDTPFYYENWTDMGVGEKIEYIDDVHISGPSSLEYKEYGDYFITGVQP